MGASRLYPVAFSEVEKSPSAVPVMRWIGRRMAEALKKE